MYVFSYPPILFCSPGHTFQTSPNAFPFKGNDKENHLITEDITITGPRSHGMLLPSFRTPFLVWINPIPIQSHSRYLNQTKQKVSPSAGQPKRQTWTCSRNCAMSSNRRCKIIIMKIQISIKGKEIFQWMSWVRATIPSCSCFSISFFLQKCSRIWNLWRRVDVRWTKVVLNTYLSMSIRHIFY